MKNEKNSTAEGTAIPGGIADDTDGFRRDGCKLNRRRGGGGGGGGGYTGKKISNKIIIIIIIIILNE